MKTIIGNIYFSSKLISKKSNNEEESSLGLTLNKMNSNTENQLSSLVGELLHSDFYIRSETE